MTDYRKPEVIYKDLRVQGFSPLEAELKVDDIILERGGKSRREVLTRLLEDIVCKHGEEIMNAKFTYGPRGGVNAARIPGWVKSPHSDISRAIKLVSELAWRKGWSGGGTTPEVFIPECIKAEALDAWRKVYLS
jgi:hypothetical protein